MGNFPNARLKRIARNDSDAVDMPHILVVSRRKARDALRFRTEGIFGKAGERSCINIQEKMAATA